MNRRMRGRRRAAIGVAMCLALAACGGGGGDSDEADGGPIVVLTRNSLKGVVRRLATEFEKNNPDVDVTVSAAKSGKVRDRAGKGDGDVYIDRLTAVEKAHEANGDSSTPVSFGDDVMQIVTKEGNPLRVEGLNVFGLPDAKTVVCRPKTRCGRLARQVLRKAKITLEPDGVAPGGPKLSERIASGGADVGLLLRTSVRNNDERVDGVTVPESQNVRLVYHAMQLSNSSTAAAFVEFLSSSDAQNILRTAGYLS